MKKAMGAIFGVIGGLVWLFGVLFMTLHLLAPVVVWMLKIDFTFHDYWTEFFAWVGVASVGEAMAKQGVQWVKGEK